MRRAASCSSGAWAMICIDAAIHCGSVAWTLTAGIPPWRYMPTAWLITPVASWAPVRAPAEVPTIRSASPRSVPCSWSALMSPAIHAAPAWPPPDSTRALLGIVMMLSPSFHVILAAPAWPGWHRGQHRIGPSCGGYRLYSGR